MINMNTIYRFFSVVALIAACHAASAQDLDPTVVVNRAYEGKLMEVHKPALEMAVPDSLMRFDLDFDYSVFDRPYKGSYEFNPYLLSMKPSVSSDRSGVLYLRAGAGYRLHPELDLVWSPVVSKKTNALKMNVYAHHRSYVGEYYEIDRVIEDINKEWQENNRLIRNGRVWDGYDLRSKAGLDMTYDWTGGVLGFDAGYAGLHQKDPRWARGYNAFDGSFHVASKALSEYSYGLRARYRAAVDNSTGVDDQAARLGEQLFDLSATIGKAMTDRKSYAMDVDVSSAVYSDLLTRSLTAVSVTPKYIYDHGVLHAALGVNFDVAFDVDKQQVVYPDVDIRLKVIPELVSAYVRLGGGAEVMSYASILEMTPHIKAASALDMRSAYPGYGDMQYQLEDFSAVAGFEGRIRTAFSYNVYGGYADYRAGMLDWLMPEMISMCCLRKATVPYKKSFAALDMMWKSETFKADASVVYTYPWGEAFDESDPQTVRLYLRPAAFKGNVSFEYNYNRRIFVGMDCEFRTSMSTAFDFMLVPGYADLGLSAEYVTSRDHSFWVRGGNVLGMTIQRVPLYAEKGLYFTLGISLKL